MDSPEFWRWIWLGSAVVFAIGEMTTPGSFFLLPFAFGAGVAAVLGFADVSVAIQWLGFVAVSGGSFLALRPLARRLDIGEPSDGIGAKRLIGEAGVVLAEIPAGAGELGLVRVGREEWRAESEDGSAVADGAAVKVVEVRGTRVVVYPSDRPQIEDPSTTESRES